MFAPGCERIPVAATGQSRLNQKNDRYSRVAEASGQTAANRADRVLGDLRSRRSVPCGSVLLGQADHRLVLHAVVVDGAHGQARG